MTKQKTAITGVRFKASTKKYEARVCLNGQETSRTFATKEEAIAWYKARKESKHSECHLTFMQLFPSWLESLAKDDEYSPQTVTRYASMTKNYLQPQLGRLKVKDFNEAKASDFAITLKGHANNLDNKTIKNTIFCLSNFLDYCYINKFIILNPIKTPAFKQHFSLLVRKKKQQFKDSVLEKARSPEELKMLISGCYEKDFETGIVAEFLLVTALRLGEASALTWGDILQNGFSYSVLVKKTRYGLTKEIQHKAKSGSNGLVPLTEQVTQKLFELKSRLEQSGFDTSKNGVMFPSLAKNQKGWSHRLGELSLRLKIRYTTAHYLRHSSLTYLASQGHSTQQIQKFGRHTDYKMSQAYVDTAYIGISGLAKTMDNVLIPNLKLGYAL